MKPARVDDTPAGPTLFCPHAKCGAQWGTITVRDRPPRDHLVAFLPGFGFNGNLVALTVMAQQQWRRAFRDGVLWKNWRWVSRRGEPRRVHNDAGILIVP